MAMGLFIVFFKDLPVFVLFSQYIDPVFWKGEDISESTKLYKSFMYSFSGTYVMLWGILLFAITKCAFKPENKWAWNSILITTLVWFFTMFPFSLYYKVYVNAFGDMVFFILIMIPLVFTKKQFISHKFQ